MGGVTKTKQYLLSGKVVEVIVETMQIPRVLLPSLHWKPLNHAPGLSLGNQRVHKAWAMPKVDLFDCASVDQLSRLYRVAVNKDRMVMNDH